MTLTMPIPDYSGLALPPVATAVAIGSLPAVSTQQAGADHWVEVEARRALTEVEEGGRLYSFEEVFSESL
jgi:hypothetical protein